jgi:glycogen(starch) synthase
MRILFWSETFWPRIGGVENLAARLLPALRARGHEFMVVTWAHTEYHHKIQYREIPVYSFPFFSRGSHGGVDVIMEHLRQVAHIKQTFAPDLVHINSYGRSVLFHLMTANAHPAPMLLTLHQALPDEPVRQNTILGKLLAAADWVVGISDSVLDHATRVAQGIIPHSSVIHNALEIPAGNPPPISFDRRRLLCLGRLVTEKGFDVALSAFTTVRERFPDARLVIVGDGPERKNLVTRTATLRLGDAVEFVGGVTPEEVAYWISGAAVVLIPSRLEGFGLVALEAALLGRPVVATRVGGIPEIVVHEETGLLVEKDDADGFARAVRFLMEHPQTASQMGRNAQTRARALFNWDVYVKSYDDLYHRLHQEHAASG